jgi:hypothetical protein
MKPLSPLSSTIGALGLILGSLAAQSNAIPGSDINVFGVDSPSYYGRVGAPYPGGTAGFAIGHSMGNCGTVHIPWSGFSGGLLIDNHVKIAFLLARESDGRMVQISGKSFCKHSRTAFNFSGLSPCSPCQTTGPSAHFRIGCHDIYSAGFNSSWGILGPTTEIDPWLGTWNPLGSYFDIGDPAQANYPQPADRSQSLSTTGFTPEKNRLAVREKDLAVPGSTFYGQNQVVIIGEPVANRGNNQVSRGMNFSWNGSSWSVSMTGTAVHGSVLTRWTGASWDLAGNGTDDGRFLVAVKVTGPVDGLWHYEYAVHNLDNHRGGASLRIPLCDDARIQNLGFHDLDEDALNDWTTSRSGGELLFQAGIDNPLDWNTFYNFYFDSDAAPIAGNVEVDQARIGPGALFVTIPSTVPGLLGTQYLGAGCGAPAPRLEATGVPSSPNPTYGMELTGTPNAAVLIAFASQAASAPLGACTLWLDEPSLLATALVGNDGAGNFAFTLPIPAGLLPTDLAVQAFELDVSGFPASLLAASNGLLIRAASTGCP